LPIALLSRAVCRMLVRRLASQARPVLGSSLRSAGVVATIPKRFLATKDSATAVAQPPIWPSLPPLTEQKVAAHVTPLDPSHPIGVPAGVVTAKPHVYWFLGTIGLALFVKWVVHKHKSPKFVPGQESEQQKTERLAKLNVALTRVAEFEKWAAAQKKEGHAGLYDEKKLSEALVVAAAVKAELQQCQSVDVVIDNGRKRLPLLGNVGGGLGSNLFDFLFLLPLLPIGIAQWAFRKAEDTLFPPKLWNSETSLTLLGEQVQDPHVLLPAAVQPSWWQRQNYYRQRSCRMFKFSGKHIHPHEYHRVWLIADDTEAPHEHSPAAEHGTTAAAGAH